jgi:hypothetical protein
MMQVDTRMGGQPQYILTEEPESLMHVPDEVRKSVVFVGYKTPTAYITWLARLSLLLTLSLPTIVILGVAQEC